MTPALRLLVSLLHLAVLPAVAEEASHLPGFLVRPDEIHVTQRERTFVIALDTAAPVRIDTAWKVFTDFANMPRFSPSLEGSKATPLSDNLMRVEQHGTAHFGPFSMHFESVREVTMSPPREIHSHQVSGTTKAMESWLRLRPLDDVTLVEYRAEITPETLIPLLGPYLVKRETAKQFTYMLQEMQRREGR